MSAAEARVPELRFPEFEGEQNTTITLSNLAIPKGLQTGPFGSQLKASEYVDDLNGIPVVMPRDISEGKIVDFQIARVDSTKSEEMKRHWLKSGDVVFPRRGELGRIAIASKAQEGWLCGTGCLRFRPNEDLVFSHFLGQLFQGSRVLHWLESNAVGQTMLNLNTEILGDVPVSIPSLPEQMKIAAFLGAVDGKMAALREKAAALVRFKRGLMQALFSQTLRFTRDDGSPYPDWEEKQLGDFAEADSGYPVPGDQILEASTETPLLRGINITEGHIRHSKEVDRFLGREVAELDRYLVKSGDMVIGMDGSKVGKNVAIVSAKDAGAFLVQRVARVRSNGENSLPFIYHHITSERFRRYVDRVNTSSGIPHISLKQIREFSIPRPHPDEQQKIADALSAMDAKIATVNEQIDRLNAFKKGLLQQMFV